MVTDDEEGHVFIYDPTASGREPVELSGHTSPVTAAAVTLDGRVVTGNDGETLVQGPARDRTLAQISVRVQALVVETGPAGDALIEAAHPGTGLSQWVLPASLGG